jgi:hypothetical protein
MNAVTARNIVEQHQYLMQPNFENSAVHYKVHQLAIQNDIIPVM